MKSGVALVTGCSTGIGRELAQQLVALGWTVYAGARQPQVLDALASERLIPLQLDVADHAQLLACRDRLAADVGRLDLLVNNAGYGAMGPAIEMPMEQVRQQFEVNVFAPLALAQVMLPLLEQSGQGTLVNIGSVSGVLTTPFSGAYCASKAALHGLSDALRMELAPLGIRVTTIQPGAIQSEFGNNAARNLADTLPADSRYQALRPYIDARAMASQDGGTPTAGFVRDLVKAITADNPPAVKRLGRGGLLLPALKRLLPAKLLDRVLSRKFGLDKLS